MVLHPAPVEVFRARSFRPQGEGCLHDLVRSAVEMLQGCKHPGFFRDPPAAILWGKEPGVSGDQVRRLGELTIASKAKPMVLQELTRSAIIGKWAVEIMEKCYLSSISLQAGFTKEVG